MKKKTGFTLVEIMIVVAIIGLLAAIAIPSFVKARNTSRINACVNNLRLIDAGKQQWAMDENAADDATPDATNIQTYVRSLPICPAGGTTFADSYEINDLNTSPTCLQTNATHTATL